MGASTLVVLGVLAAGALVLAGMAVERRTWAWDRFCRRLRTAANLAAYDTAQDVDRFLSRFRRLRKVDSDA